MRPNLLFAAWSMFDYDGAVMRCEATRRQTPAIKIWTLRPVACKIRPSVSLVFDQIVNLAEIQRLCANILPRKSARSVLAMIIETMEQMPPNHNARVFGGHGTVRLRGQYQASLAYFCIRAEQCVGRGGYTKSR